VRSRRAAAGYGSVVDTESRELLGLLILVPASLAVIVYVFLRIGGVVGRKRHTERPPPPPMA
jgi:hypothetical protein